MVLQMIDPYCVPLLGENWVEVKLSLVGTRRMLQDLVNLVELFLQVFDHTFVLESAQSFMECQC